MEEESPTGSTLRVKATEVKESMAVAKAKTVTEVKEDTAVAKVKTSGGKVTSQCQRGTVTSAVKIST